MTNRSISTSIDLIKPIWEPYFKNGKKNIRANPFFFYKRNFNELSNCAEILSELYPPYAVGWIRMELAIENYFIKRLNKWRRNNSKLIVTTEDDVINDLIADKKFLDKIYNSLVLNNITIKKSIKNKLTRGIEIPAYLDKLKESSNIDDCV